MMYFLFFFLLKKRLAFLRKPPCRRMWPLSAGVFLKRRWQTLHSTGRPPSAAAAAEDDADVDAAADDDDDSVASTTPLVAAVAAAAAAAAAVVDEVVVAVADVADDDGDVHLTFSAAFFDFLPNQINIRELTVVKIISIHHGCSQRWKARWSPKTR